MTIDEIKLLRLKNQHLLNRADKITVVRDLLGIQAQFMSNALHALKIRCSDFDADTVSDGLVKNWTIRGTVHIFSQSDLPLFIHCNGGKDYRRNEWTEDNFWNQRNKWALSGERQRELSQVILSALENGTKTREELKDICCRYGMTAAEEGSMFDPWGGGIRLLCERGFINYVVQEKKAFCLSPEFTPLSEDEAALERARRYFANYGPATIHDAMYFFHVTSSSVKEWLSKLPVTSFSCEGKEYYYIERGLQNIPDMPACLFLAGFDQLMLGYEKKESLFLDQENLRRIFNLAGIVMPALMLHGKIAGRWKKQNRKLSIELFHSVTAAEENLIRDRAESLWPEVQKIEFLI